MSILDDKSRITQIDSQDALGLVSGQYEQLKKEYEVDFSPKDEIRNIVLTGMGGSALYAVFFNSWPGLKAPIEIIRNYDIPAYVDKHTLFICSSYSGNTEEPLEAVEKAKDKGAQIVAIASGGKLMDRAKEAGYPLYEVPASLQPRMGTFYMIRALTHLLEGAGLIPNGSLEELYGVSDWLAEEVKAWMPDVPTDNNRAKQLAEHIVGKSAVIYSGYKLFAAANKWKIGINENAKNVAWCNYYPEFNHNEFIGWSSHPVEKPYGVIEIRSNLEHPRIQKRFEVSERLLSGLRPKAEVVEPKGDTLIKQLLWTVSLSEFMTVYLAVLNGVNPMPVELVEKLKKELN